jgi:hypothetical protein
MNSPTLPVTNLSALLQNNGFVHVPSLCSHIPGAINRESAFNAHWDDLVLDENYKSYTTRYRRILRYWYEHPGRLIQNANSVYIPKVTYNADYAHGANHLAYATPIFVNDELMQAIIRFDLAVLSPFLTNGQEYSIDIDLFQVSSTEGKVSPTTSGRHQDGEDWLCMHFVGARNIKPVISGVFSADKNQAPLFSRSMTKFLETLIVNDRSLFHAAGPVEQQDPALPAHRNLLLVSLSAIAAIPDVEQ